jgi:hypothetical protein
MSKSNVLISDLDRAIRERIADNKDMVHEDYSRFSFLLDDSKFLQEYLENPISTVSLTEKQIMIIIHALESRVWEIENSLDDSDNPMTKEERKDANRYIKSLKKLSGSYKKDWKPMRKFLKMSKKKLENEWTKEALRAEIERQIVGLRTCWEQGINSALSGGNLSDDGLNFLLKYLENPIPLEKLDIYSAEMLMYTFHMSFQSVRGLYFDAIEGYSPQYLLLDEIEQRMDFLEREELRYWKRAKELTAELPMPESKDRFKSPNLGRSFEEIIVEFGIDRFRDFNRFWKEDPSMSGLYEKDLNFLQQQLRNPIPFESMTRSQHALMLQILHSKEREIKHQNSDCEGIAISESSKITPFLEYISEQIERHKEVLYP